MGSEPFQPGNLLDRLTRQATLETYYTHMQERERTIVYLRFFQGMTQSEIAAQLGISQMHVSRLLARSLAQLRSVAADT